MIQEQCLALIQKSGFLLTETESTKLITIDYGLGDFHSEGVTYFDLLLSDRLRITLLILLPKQTLPEHFHPFDDEGIGKEETLRGLYGETKLYVDGPVNTTYIDFPKNKNLCYTARHEIRLSSGTQFTIAPGVKHWFQAGEEGSVLLAFQNRVDETKNVFTDPSCANFQLSLKNQRLYNERTT